VAIKKARFKVTIADDRWHGEIYLYKASRIVVDPSKNPKTMDLIVNPVKVNRDLRKAIYKLEGDTVTIAVGEKNGKRPEKFAAEKGSSDELWVFQRRKPAKGTGR